VGSLTLLDVDPYDDDSDHSDIEDDSMYITPTIDPNQPVAYLDQLNVAPNATAYSSVQKLSSEIAFVAP
jgi:hypothetical protein